MEVSNRAMRNQDLLRSSIDTISSEAITRALLWLRGEATYPYPTSIHLNLTLRCAARCFHCLQWSWPNHSELTVSQLKKLFEIFKVWGVQMVTQLIMVMKITSEAGSSVTLSLLI